MGFFGPSQSELEEYARFLVVAMDKDLPPSIHLMTLTAQEKKDLSQLKGHSMKKIIKYLSAAAPECDREYIRTKGTDFLSLILSRI